MKARHIVESAGPRGRRNQVGDLVDHPDCYLLCELGYCVPADQQCVDKLHARGYTQFTLTTEPTDESRTIDSFGDDSGTGEDADRLG